MMFVIPAVAAFFKYKIVSSIIILTCGNKFEQIRLVRQLSEQGMRAAVSCDPSVLDNEINSLQGVLYINRPNNTLLDETSRKHFSMWHKWLIIADEVPSRLNHSIRYDADIALLDPRQGYTGIIDAIDNTSLAYESLIFEDVYIHLRDGASRHPWAVWTRGGFQPLYEHDRIQRRFDLNWYPMRIVTPVGHYDESWYDGTFADYVVDNSLPERDSAIRCGYGTSSLIIEWLKAKEVLTQVEQWGTETGNKSMFTRLADGTSELSGGILRLQASRLSKLDYVIPLWPFKVGFTYVAERESSSNMFVMPFAGPTWAACAAITVVLALAQRATAKAPEEKEGALVAVMATWLQQVDYQNIEFTAHYTHYYFFPHGETRQLKFNELSRRALGRMTDEIIKKQPFRVHGASGRLSFMVLSICSMLVYAYYSSAIVSALMSAGSGGPTTLRALGDSKYRLASEDYDWIRYHMFDIFKPNWPEMEYLKRKKLQSMANFWMDTEAGMQLVKSGTTAYHSEFNHVYPLMRILSDDQVCRLKYVDTVPLVMSWLITTRRSQWTDILRTGGDWLLETGLAKRMVSRWQVKPPPCRAALLAERVSYGDVAPLIILTVVGFVASIVVLILERSVAKWQKKRAKSISSDETREERMVNQVI